MHWQGVVNFCQSGEILPNLVTIWCLLHPRPKIYRPRTPNFFALLFMIYSTAAYDSYKFEWEIQIKAMI